MLASAFWREHAGPFYTNLELLRGIVRAGELAERLGLDVEPDAILRRPRRAAIEVFPHPALVVLLNLAERLPYKAKKDRPLAVCHAAMCEMLAGLESFKRADPPLDVSTSPNWAQLVSACHAGLSGVPLKCLEDELDAYVCAYIGWYHLAWSGSQSLTVGDAQHGYVVTPVTPRHADLLRTKGRELHVPVR